MFDADFISEALFSHTRFQADLCQKHTHNFPRFPEELWHQTSMGRDIGRMVKLVSEFKVFDEELWNCEENRKLILEATNVMLKTD